MATYTANYGLHQWVPGDNFLRTDFNTDFQKIDAGIKAALSTAQGKPDIVTGTYTGDDAASRTISLGFQPKALFIEAQDGRRDASRISGGLALPGAPMCRWSGSASGGPAVLQLTASGFQVSNDTSIYGHLNNNTMNYRYLAVK